MHIKKSAPGGGPSVREWDALLSSVLKSVEPTDAMTARFREEKRGLSFIYAQAMQEQNPEFFQAMTNVVMKNCTLTERIIEKIDTPRARVTFLQLRQNGLGGKVGELMHAFSQALETGRDNLSAMDAAQAHQFIRSVEKTGEAEDVPDKKQMRAPAQVWA